MKGWRTALRIARREAKRSKGRSVLVVLMIWVPVVALTFAAVSYDMFELTAEEKANRELGRSQAGLAIASAQPIIQTFDGSNYHTLVDGAGQEREPDRPPIAPDALPALLPAGSRLVPVQHGGIDVRTVAGTGQLEAYGLDLADPIVAGIAAVTAGRAPATPTEVALTEEAVERTGAGLGGTVTFADGTKSYTVVGLVEMHDSLTELAVFRPNVLAEFDPAQGGGPAGSGWNVRWLVDSPTPIGWDQVTALNRKGLLVVSRSVLLDPPPAELDPVRQAEEAVGVPLEDLSIGVIVAGLGLLEVVLLAGPAFAVGVRRRQRQLALVAANGGTPAHIRKIVLADGVVLGAVGAVSGIVVGIVAAFAGRPLLETYLFDARAGGYRVFPVALVAVAALALVIGLAAALVPAFVASRQNVVQALSGRRGVTRSRKRWLILGVVLTVVGALIAGYGARTIDSTLILAGVVVGELGLVLCTPSLVGLIARAGRILPLAPRIALRDTARNRSSAAPAISAVMAAVAGSVAIGVYFASDEARQRAGYQAAMPDGYSAVMLHNRQETGASAPADLQAKIERAAHETLPVSETRWLNSVACTPADIELSGGPPDGSGRSTEPTGCYFEVSPVLPPEQKCPFHDRGGELTEEEMAVAIADERCNVQRTAHSSLAYGAIADDGSGLGALTGTSGTDLARAQAVLRSGGAIVTDPRYVKDGKVQLRFMKMTAKDGFSAPERTVTLPAHLLATRLVSDRVVVSPAVIRQLGGEAVTSVLVAATTRMPSQAEEDAFRAAVTSGGIPASVEVERGPDDRIDPMLLLVALVAALITLGATGIATGLAAADGRADLSTLAAVGASPRLRRSLSLSQSGVIAGLGGLLGALAGVGAAAAILFGLNEVLSQRWPGPASYPIELPWLNLLLSMLVVPAVAMLGAGLLTRSRLPIERRGG